MTKLGVNIDHVATVREARKTDEPDPIWAAGRGGTGRGGRGSLFICARIGGISMIATRRFSGTSWVSS